MLCNLGVFGNVCPDAIADLPTIDPPFSYAVQTFTIDVDTDLVVFAPTFSTGADWCNFKVTDFMFLDMATGAPTSLTVVTENEGEKHRFTIKGSDVHKTPYLLQSMGIVNDATGTEFDTGLVLEVNILHKCWSAVITSFDIDNF